MANLAVPYFDEKVLQFYIERPNLIPDALQRGFVNQMARGGQEKVHKDLERYIWNFPTSGEASDPRVKKLIIWFLRQSKNLTEPIVLDYSPYHDSFNEVTLTWPAKAAYLADLMNSSGAPGLCLYYFFRVEGIFLHFLSATHDNCGATFFLTKETYSIKGARKLMWNDAVLGLEQIEEPKKA
jgi:hypothetical protein